MEFADFFEALTECSAAGDFVQRQGWSQTTYDRIIDAISDGTLPLIVYDELEASFADRSADWPYLLECSRGFFVALMRNWDDFVQRVQPDALKTAEETLRAAQVRRMIADIKASGTAQQVEFVYTVSQREIKKRYRQLAAEQFLLVDPWLTDALLRSIIHD